MREVLFDESALISRQRILEVRRHKLHQLAADDLVRRGSMR
jgi:hypothetical protein